MDDARRELGAVADRAIVGDEFDRDVAFGQHLGESLRRKQMAAGAAGRDQNGASRHRA